jgi:hypothetical protein
MASKYDEKCEGYSDDGKDECFSSDAKGCKDSTFEVPKIEITAIEIDGSPRPVSDPIDLRIVFELDRFRMKLCDIYYIFNSSVITLIGCRLIEM